MGEDVPTVFLGGPYMETFEETAVPTSADCHQECLNRPGCGKWAFQMHRSPACVLKAIGEPDCAVTKV